MGNIDLKPKENLSAFRRIAIGTWATTYDPSVYGVLQIRMDEAARYLKAYRAKTGKRLTYSHILAKAIARGFEKCPDANAILRFNKIYLRDNIDIFLQVVMEDEKTGEIDLSGAKLEQVDKKSLAEIIDELERKADLVRKRKDPSLEQARNTFNVVPSLLLNVFMKVLSFLLYTLNLDLSWAGLPKDGFGSAMLTNIGSLGLQQAFVPLVPYSHVPILVAAGKVEDVPLVIDGEVRPAKIIKLNATFDHRIIDGKHASMMCNAVKEVLEDPFEFLDDIESLPGTTQGAAAEAAA